MKKRTPTRAIFICAGEGTRWENYQGVPKHFAVLNGEPIIERAVRLFREAGIEDCWLVSDDFKVKGTNFYQPIHDLENFDADKFMNSARLWNPNGRTLIIYGDVYFTEEAVKTIANDQSDGFKMFCRPTPSRLTGTMWGECFAVSLQPKILKRAYENLEKLVTLHINNVLYRVGGWEWVRAMDGVPISKMDIHKEKSDLYCVIDDETDDIDYPEDYDRLRRILG